MEHNPAVDKIESLEKTLGELATVASGLREDVRRDRQLVNGQRREMVALIIISVLLLVVGAGNYQVSHQIQGCQVPKGKCAQRESRIQYLNGQLVVLQINADRLKTQVDAAAAIGNAETSGKVYKDELKKVQTQLENTNQELDRIAPND